MGNVVFDATTGTLSGDFNFFQPLDSRPLNLQWSTTEGAEVTEGMVLGRFEWPDQPESNLVIIAPPACSGRVLRVHHDVQLDLLGDRPPQVLLEIQADDATPQAFVFEEPVTEPVVPAMTPPVTPHVAPRKKATHKKKVAQKKKKGKKASRG
jgi:hypothetical protein